MVYSVVLPWPKTSGLDIDNTSINAQWRRSVRFMN